VPVVAVIVVVAPVLAIVVRGGRRRGGGGRGRGRGCGLSVGRVVLAVRLLVLGRGCSRRRSGGQLVLAMPPDRLAPRRSG